MPPAQPSPERPGKDAGNALEAAVAAIRHTMASAAAGDPWVVSDSSVDISFAVTKAGAISLGAEGELVHEVTHSLHLSLVPPSG